MEVFFPLTHRELICAKWGQIERWQYIRFQHHQEGSQVIIASITLSMCFRPSAEALFDSTKWDPACGHSVLLTQELKYLWVFTKALAMPPASQVVLVVKNLPASAGDIKDMGSIPGSGGRKVPWRRARQPTPVFLRGESHSQRSLVGYSLLGSHRVSHDWNNFAHMPPAYCFLFP